MDGLSGSGYVLDVPELYRRLDVRRRERGLSWRAVGRELGLASSTFTRLSQGFAPDAHALVTLLVWLGLGAGVLRVSQPRGES